MTIVTEKFDSIWYLFFLVSVSYSRSPFQKVARPLPTFKNRWEKKINRKKLEKIKTVADKNRGSGATTGLLSSSWLPGWSPSVWPSGSGHFPAKNVKRAVRTHSKSLMAVHRYLKNTKLSYTTYISTFTYVFNHKFGSLYICQACKLAAFSSWPTWICRKIEFFLEF